MRPRNDFLLALEGWHTGLPNLPEAWMPFYLAWKQESHAPKFTRWVAKNFTQSELPENLAKVGEYSLTGIQYKFSCRHNDLLRLSKTDHYKTCQKNHIRGLGRQMRMNVEDPNVAIVYIPDQAGKFLGRFLVRSVIGSRGPGLLLYPLYGQSMPGVVESLSKLTELYVGCHARNNAKWPNEPREVVTNITPVKIPSIWEDIKSEFYQEPSTRAHHTPVKYVTGYKAMSNFQKEQFLVRWD